MKRELASIRSRTRYRYVEFAARRQPRFRNRIVTVDEVAALVDAYGADECYASVFRFADEVLLYLDEHRLNDRRSIAGFDGKVWAPFLPIDIDAPPAQLSDALWVAQQTDRLLIDAWKIPRAAVHLYFSGCKGFHLLVDVRALGGIAPAADVHRLFSRLRLEVLRGLPSSARQFFDLMIGDKTRLLRLPNTRHAASGLYKVALEPEELHRASADEIRTLARAPRPLTGVIAAGLVPMESVAPSAAAKANLARCRRALQRLRGPHPYRFRTPPANASAALCAARLALWQSHTELGNRNNVAIRLASAFRLAGYDVGQTGALLHDWNQRQRIGLPEPEIDSVVASAYARSFPYSYGCHDEVIRRACPYVGRWNECDDYRALTLRAGHDDHDEKS